MLFLFGVSGCIFGAFIGIFAEQFSYALENTSSSFEDFNSRYHDYILRWRIFGVVSVVVSINLIVLTLLQGFRLTGRVQEGQSGDTEVVTSALADLISELDKTLKSKQLDEALSTAERAEIVAALTKSFQNDLSPKIALFIEQKYQDQIEEQLFYKKSEEFFKSLKHRLEGFSSDLRNESTVNLFYGLTAAALGLITLLVLIFSSPQHSIDQPLAWQGLVIYYVPRVAIFLTFQAFGMFFLRIYRKNLEERRYLSNEITNVEIKRIAFAISQSGSAKEQRHSIVQAMLATDRNAS
ncbi:MAG: hypothetical protein ABJP66_18030, partial [Hyphomicrobiales bacterium]